LHKIIVIMNAILSNLKIQVNKKVFVKDPETSALGKKIIEQSILLIDEIGFDNFTFNFENKHKLLVYLSCWYWSWMEYRMVFATANISNSFEKLIKGIIVITEKIEDDTQTEYINEAILNKIIILEFTKTLHTKEVDEENKEGFFLIYKRVINRIVLMIEEVNPNYPYAKSLASTIVEGSLQQHFLTEHLKSITNCNDKISTSDYYIHLITNLLK
jgi:hypothetical protein